MERMSAGWYNHMLVPLWIGALPDVRAKLECGARAADVGCGAGRAVLRLAEAFPKSRFVGYDAFAPAVERADAHAREAGVGDRVRFEIRDVTGGLPDQPLDLVTMFNSLHDVGDPVAALTQIRKALAPDGVLLLMEIRTADSVDENRGPMSTILAGTGLLYTTPVALANGGNDFGILGFGERAIHALCQQAGFENVRRLPLDNPANALYEVRA